MEFSSQVNPIQFTGEPFLRCDYLNIYIDWSVMAHRRTNGQVERANDLVLQGLKPWVFNKLKKFVGHWATELSVVLWSLRTTPSRAMGCTPFFLTFDVQAVVTTKFKYGSPRAQSYNNEQGMEDAQLAADLLDEARDVVVIRSAKYQQDLRLYHD